MTWTARIDVAPLKHFLIVSAVFAVWLIASFLLGLLGTFRFIHANLSGFELSFPSSFVSPLPFPSGPSVMVSQVYSSYRCSDDSHLTFNSSLCTGTQPNKVVFTCFPSLAQLSGGVVSNNEN